MKKLCALILALALLCGLLPAALFSASAASEGTCGENLTWRFEPETGTLTISGTGEMDSYPYGTDKPWSSFRENIQEVILEDGVTNVSNRAFSGLNNLIKAVIPRSVRKIGKSAFASCGALESITIPTGVEEIGAYAFKSCSSLTAISLPASVKYIAVGSYGSNSAFLYCSNLSSITVDRENGAYSSLDGVLFDKERTQLYCYPEAKEDSSYAIPKTVAGISELAFYACRYLKHVTIPAGVDCILPDTFFTAA